MYILYYFILYGIIDDIGQIPGTIFSSLYLVMFYQEGVSKTRIK